jgi:hypothetical protein
MCIPSLSETVLLPPNRSGCNFLVTATEKLPVRALSYKAMFSIPGNKKFDQLKLPLRAWPKSPSAGMGKS